MIFEFDDAELDLDRYQLRRGGQAEAVEPQVFDLLAVLIRERHRVVSKEELLDTVWGNRFVSESALTSRVKAARRAVGDDGRGPVEDRRSSRLPSQTVMQPYRRNVPERECVVAAHIARPGPRTDGNVH